MTKEQFWKDEIVNSIYDGIKDKNLKVVLPEGEEDRSIASLEYVKDLTVVLLGEKDVINKKIDDVYQDNASKIKEVVEIIEPNEFQNQELIDLFVEKRKGKLTEEEAREIIKGSNYFATLLLEAGKVDALVGGSVYSTADILKPAFQIIQPAPGNRTVSSCFIMKKDNQKLVFGDCAVNVEPDKDQLKEITLQTMNTAKEMGIDPKVAMLTFSSKGSGKGTLPDLVLEAYNELMEENPELKDVIDGELQFDAAYVEAVGSKKAPGSKVAGHANVFIFPDLNSGNIGYKIAERLGGYEAVGPLLQGLNKPVNDLSRGTTADTIAKVMYLALRSKR